MKKKPLSLEFSHVRHEGTLARKELVSVPVITRVVMKMAWYEHVIHEIREGVHFNDPLVRRMPDYPQLRLSIFSSNRWEARE